MKNKVLAVLMASTMVVGLVGCGSSQTATTEEAPATEAAAETTAATEAAEETTEAATEEEATHRDGGMPWARPMCRIWRPGPAPFSGRRPLSGRCARCPRTACARRAHTRRLHRG